MEKLSIIIPVYNEKKTVESVLRKLINLKFPIEKELIVVDDASNDGTTEILKKFDKQNLIKLIQHKHNKGKGAAIKTALRFATGNIIAIQDADTEYAPEDLIKLLQPILNKKTKIVYGSRFKNYQGRKDIFYFGNRILSLITTILYFQRITDMETCYKVFKKELLKDISLMSERFEIEAELTAKFLKKKQKIIELPIRYSPRKRCEKKIRVKDGLVAFLTLLRCRFLK